MDLRARSRLEETAYHEAGHAVAAQFVRFPFRYVTIVPEVDGRDVGSLVYKPWKEASLDWSRLDKVAFRLQRHVVIGLAGQISEGKMRGRRPRYGMGSDNRQVVDLILNIGSEKTVNAFMKYCWCVTEDFVDLRWAEISAVAQALLDRKTLKQSDVAELIRLGSSAPTD